MSRRRKSGAQAHQLVGNDAATVDLAPSSAFHTWWNIDSDQSRQGHPQAGAERLLQRCMDVYPWDREFAVRVLGAYCQFLKLKSSFEDWECTSLWPSMMVDMMWHQHVLDTRHYRNDCFSLFNRMVHYGPVHRPHDDVTTKLIETTKIALMARFGAQKVDDEIWSFSAGDMNAMPAAGDSESQDRKRGRPEESPVSSEKASIDAMHSSSSKKKPSANSSMHSSSSSRKKTAKRSRSSDSPARKNNASRSSQVSRSIQIILKGWDGESCAFNVSPSATVGQIKKAYADIKTVEEKTVHLFYNGYPLPGETTCADLGIENGSEISAELEQGLHSDG